MSKSFTQHFIAVSIHATVFLFLGCDPKAKTICQQSIQAIKEIHHFHLHPYSKEVTREYFKRAQLKLLDYHFIQLSEEEIKKAPYSLEAQCMATMSLVSKAIPQADFNTLSLQLIDFYVQQLDPHSHAGDLGYVNRFLENKSTAYGIESERFYDTVEKKSFEEVTDTIPGSSAASHGLEVGARFIPLTERNLRRMQLYHNDPKGYNLETGGLDKPRSSLDMEVVETEDTVSEHKKIISIEKTENSYVPIDSRTLSIPNDSTAQTSKSSFTIGHIKVRSFTDYRTLLLQVLKNFKDYDGLILDLRGLWGGKVEAAVKFSSFFLPPQVPFVRFIKKDHKLEPEFVPLTDLHASKLSWKKPMVVLVNAGTCSSGEILAGALQDYGYLVIGSRTYGKGTRQTLMRLHKYGISGFAHFTDAYSIRPSGLAIQLNGIEPNISIHLGKKYVRRDFIEARFPNVLPLPAEQPPLVGYSEKNKVESSSLSDEELSILKAQLIEATPVDRVKNFQKLYMDYALRSLRFLINRNQLYDTHSQ